MKTQRGKPDTFTRKYALLGLFLVCLVAIFRVGASIQQWTASRVATQASQCVVAVQNQKLAADSYLRMKTLETEIAAAVQEYRDACDKYSALPEYCSRDQSEECWKKVVSACKHLVSLCCSRNELESVIAEIEHREPDWFFPDVPSIIAKNVFLEAVVDSDGKVSMACGFLGMRDPFHQEAASRWFAERRAKDRQDRRWANGDKIKSYLFPANEVCRVPIPYTRAKKIVPAFIGTNYVVVLDSKALAAC